MRSGWPWARPWSAPCSPTGSRRGSAASVPPPEAYNDALTPVFGYLVPLMVASAIALVLVRPRPLATTV